MEANLALFLGRRQISTVNTHIDHLLVEKVIVCLFFILDKDNVKLRKKVSLSHGFFVSSSLNSKNNCVDFLGGNKKRYINSVSLIDRSARIGFPLSFGILILLYWLIYVTYQDDFPLIKQQGRAQ